MKIPAKRRVFEIIQIGRDHDIASIVFDFFIAFTIFLNLFITLFETFEQSRPYLPLIHSLELATSCIFAVEYALRIWTAEYLYPRKSRRQAKITFVFSFFGIIDLLSFLPYFLPVIFPTGIVTFRMFRVVRIFRNLVGGVYPADRRLRRHLPGDQCRTAGGNRDRLSGRGNCGNSHWYYFRGFCGAVYQAEIYG